MYIPRLSASIVFLGLTPSSNQPEMHGLRGKPPPSLWGYLKPVLWAHLSTKLEIKWDIKLRYSWGSHSWRIPGSRKIISPFLTPCYPLTPSTFLFESQLLIVPLTHVSDFPIGISFLRYFLILSEPVNLHYTHTKQRNKHSGWHNCLALRGLQLRVSGSIHSQSLPGNPTGH